MNIIKNEIIVEKSRVKPNDAYLKMLNNLLKHNEVTITDFSVSGKIVPVDVFKKNYSISDIHSECTDVVVYLCGFYIQMLKSGRYVYKFNMNIDTEVELEHKSLDVVERLAWDNFISKQFN
jgi:hypothetical protein